jgi:LPS export ABC transporter protein LptC
MSLSHRWLWILVFLGAGFGIVFFLLSLPRPSPLKEEVETQPEEVVEPTSFPITTEKVRVRGWEEGKLHFLLEAGAMELDKEGTVGKCLGGVRLLVFEDNGQVRATLHSETALLNLTHKNVRLRGKVEVVSSSGDRLETEELFYLNARRTIQTGSWVRAYFNGNEVESEGFQSDVDLSNPEFFRVTRGIFRLKSSSP